MTSIQFAQGLRATRVFCWSLSWTLALGTQQYFFPPTLGSHDWMDDFQFSTLDVDATYWSESSSQFFESRIQSVLSTRLDLFPQSQVSRLSQHLLTLCQATSINPAYVLSLIDIESRFRVKARSSVGAIGLMQLMRPTASFIRSHLRVPHTGFEPFSEAQLRSHPLHLRAIEDPFVNLSLGVTYLGWLRDHYTDHTPYAILAAYNAGPHRVDGWLGRPLFRPKHTKKYFTDIRRGASQLFS